MRPPIFNQRLPEYDQRQKSCQHQRCEHHLNDRETGRVFAKKPTCNNAACTQEPVSGPSEPIKHISLRRLLSSTRYTLGSLLDAGGPHCWWASKANIPAIIARAIRVPTTNAIIGCRLGLSSFEPALFCAAPMPSQKGRLPIDGNLALNGTLAVCGLRQKPAGSACSAPCEGSRGRHTAET